VAARVAIDCQNLGLGSRVIDGATLRLWIARRCAVSEAVLNKFVGDALDRTPDSADVSPKVLVRP
jgi:hypothetical protein